MQKMFWLLCLGLLGAFTAQAADRSLPSSMLRQGYYVARSPSDQVIYVVTPGDGTVSVTTGCDQDNNCDYENMFLYTGKGLGWFSAFGTFWVYESDPADHTFVDLICGRPDSKTGVSQCLQFEEGPAPEYAFQQPTALEMQLTVQEQPLAKPRLLRNGKPIATLR